MAEEATLAEVRGLIGPRLRKLARKTGCEFEVEVALVVKGRRTYKNEAGETFVAVGERAATLTGLKGNKDTLRAMIASLAVELHGTEPDFSDDD